MRFWMIFYKVLSVIFLPFIAIYLLLRVFKKKEQFNRLCERFGFAKCSKNFRDSNSSIIWIHGVSVGEANCAFFLAEELLKFSPHLKILLTTTTLTSARIIEQKITDYEDKIIHQLLPVDVDFFVKKFLNFWHPKAIIFIESEIWPNIIATAKSMAISTFLVNARISNKSLKNWQKIKKLGFNIFDYFSIIFAQSSEEQIKIQQICANQVMFHGNLKAQTKILNVNEQELRELKKQINNRLVWLCASTHKGEEEIILNIHRKLREDFKDLLTIIVPRHPARINEITALCNQEKIVIRSKKEDIVDASEIYIADTLNELGIFYSLVDFAFIGGSLFPIGGHNPFEAIKLNCTAISGFGVANFAEIYHELSQNEGVIMVKNSDELYDVVKDFFNGKKSAGNYTNKALQILEKNNYCVKNIIKKIDQILSLNV
jgi:3-deoxy-D-manno-octulosonic-acid transferase